MPEQETKEQSPASLGDAARLGFGVATKQFDVALVDPNDHTVEHWPRLRVTIQAVTAKGGAGTTDTDGAATATDAERAAAEHQAAIIAYNAEVGLETVEKPHLYYDVRPAEGPAPVEPEAWKKHRCPVEGAPYWRGRK